MDQFVYLILATYLFVFWLWFVVRSERTSRIVLISLVGMLAGPAAEVFYFYDYWRPPTLFGVGVISVEDFVAGLALAGIPMAFYDVCYRQPNVRGAKPRLAWFVGLFVACAIGLALTTFVFQINSMLASPLFFLLATVVMLTMRPDLLTMAFVSGAGLLIVILPVYLILFNVVAPNYWDDYGLFSDTLIDVSVLGIPVTELFWYATWGALAGIAYPFARGYVKQQFSKSGTANHGK